MSKTKEIPISGGLDIALPKMALVRQWFDDARIADVPNQVISQIKRPEIQSRVKPGMTIAVGAGSRGITDIKTVIRATVGVLKQLGAKPFVFPAMGSHGGATAAGQQKVLATYGICEEFVGAPVRATMETVQVSQLDDRTPVCVDRHAHEADGIVLVNRIKPHTAFRAPIESGLVKMMVIGMGKIEGATHMHWHGCDQFHDILPKAAAQIMQHSSFLFGVGMVQNAFDQTAIVEAILPENLFERETALLVKAKALMGRLLLTDIDVLVMEQMGKEISGTGFDPNVTGRNARNSTGFSEPRVQKIVVLSLSPETQGNATGLGLADVITQQLHDAIDYPATYSNVITSTFLDGALIPIAMPTDQQAIQLAVKTLVRVKQGQARIVQIKDTKSLQAILVSQPMLPEVDQHPDMSLISDPAPIDFSPEGTLKRL